MQRSSAQPPPGTMPSSTAARVAFRASVTLSFFSFTSTSLVPPTCNKPRVKGCTRAQLGQHCCHQIKQSMPESARKLTHPLPYWQSSSVPQHSRSLSFSSSFHQVLNTFNTATPSESLANRSFSFSFSYSLVVTSSCSIIS